ncbi:TonB family protein [Pseudodesulfovibrio sediminis]|uniref:TonB C-terminal domain-containing protein n=1 Tax=Pseudodesulfovibrio sediminis TaxID=2810563 RepID=A0ABN6EXE8_9BACT|nr:energy transducer TonB [Pseudodesulfovibrio sediminis]BCS89929.1 hypothetical protein PSDVSF_31710 [Pseudodesulfovibrio sediminis]
MGASRITSILSHLFSLRNCVLLSVLVHLVIFSFPCKNNTVKAMPGSISMALVSGTGKIGHGKESINVSTRSDKFVTQPKAVQQEKSPAPDNKQQSMVQPERKPAPVVRRASAVSTASQKRPVKKAASAVKTKSKPVVRPRKVVKKKDVHPAAPAKKIHDHEVVAKKNQPVKAKDADTPEKQVVKTGQNAASNTGQEVANADQGIHAQSSRSAGGSTSEGPLHARIGSLFGPKITRWVRPKYPRKARAMGQTGLVVLRITIDSLGSPVQVEVVQKAGSGFDEAAVTAVKKSSFSPATHKGDPVACIALLPVHFTLKGN